MNNENHLNAFKILSWFNPKINVTRSIQDGIFTTNEYYKVETDFSCRMFIWVEFMMLI